MGEDRDLKLGR